MLSSINILPLFPLQYGRRYFLLSYSKYNPEYWCYREQICYRQICSQVQQPQCSLFVVCIGAHKFIYNTFYEKQSLPKDEHSQLVCLFDIQYTDTLFTYIKNPVLYRCVTVSTEW